MLRLNLKEGMREGGKEQTGIRKKVKTWEVKRGGDVPEEEEGLERGKAPIDLCVETNTPTATEGNSNVDS